MFKNSWLVLALATGCMLGPSNGTTTNQNVVGKTFTFQGYFNEPNEFIYVEVLEDPALDPNIDGNWAGFTATKSSTDPQYINSDTPLYAWSATGAPVPANADAVIKKRWPQGGVARIRAFHIGDDGQRELLTTFDEVNSNCLTDGYAAGDDWKTIGTKCAGLGDKEIAVVSTSPLPSHFPFLSAKGTSIAALYYNTIDAPPNLGSFRQRYGFNSDPGSVITAKYYNDGDLGLGREMNCKSFGTLSGPGIACYVRNFSGYDATNAFAENLPEQLASTVLANMISGAHDPFATVAMVYIPPANTTNSVRFIVYGADGNLANNAQLDYAGDNDTIPNNCVACHGIDTTVSTNALNVNVDGKAEFLPFDPFAYKFSTSAPWRLADQQNAFRKLNQLVKITNPPAATTQLIDGLYAPKSISDSTAVATNTFMPAAWKPDDTLDGEALYNGVVKPYCRTCHVSSNTNSLDFNTYEEVKARAAQIRGDVCGTKRMPHAERVQHKFWQSGARAYVLTGLGATGADALAACKP